MDTITFISTISGAIGVSSAIQILLNKWANKKKEALDVQAVDIANREKTFNMLCTINDKLTAEIADLTQKLIAARTQMSEVVNHKITLVMENADLKSQNELLKKENDNYRNTINELKEKMTKMEAQIKELQKKHT
jgi:chromosome segregation ATPase